MIVARLPMFPLGSVLLPGAVLPLHVFEPRYRALVRDCLVGDAEFGVVLIERGSEVGGGDQRTMWGTLARIVQVAEAPDGRYAVVAVGMHRIRVLAWLPDDPYPVAEVEDWPDESTSDLASDLQAVLVRIRRALAMAVELGDVPGGAMTDLELADDPALAAFQLIALAPVGPADRQRLLGMDGPAERLEELSSLLDDVEAALQFRLQQP